MAIDFNGHELPPELRDVVDEYDRGHHADLIDDYEPLFEAFRQMRRAHPEWRFGQMVVNLALWAGTTRPGDAYEVPDGRLLAAAKEHLARLDVTLTTPSASSR